MCVERRRVGLERRYVVRRFHLRSNLTSFLLPRGFFCDSNGLRDNETRGEVTVLPLDLVVLINSFFLYERLTDENFQQAIALWFENEEQCRFRFGHISGWKTSRVTNMVKAFYNRRNFNEDIRRWNVGRVTNMRFMFHGASRFNQGIVGQWNVSSVTNMYGMFYSASQFNQDIDWSMGCSTY
jgi:hypothetical protein